MKLMGKDAERPFRGIDGQTFGQRLAGFRHAQDFTQPELGELVGVSSRALCSYERDQREPPAHVLPGLAKHLNVTLDELMGIEESRTKKQPAIARRWLRKFEHIERLTDRKQRAIMQVLDMALKSTP